MTQKLIRKSFSRRDFLKIAGAGVVTAAGASLLPQFLRKTLVPERVVLADEIPPNLYFAGTDGWFHLPDNSPAIPPYFPDNLAPGPADGYPDGMNGYIFGFRNITGMTDVQKANQKQRAQHNAPLFWVDQFDETKIDPLTGKPVEFRMKLTNLGLAMRPDLTDSHTLHWHGFRNVIPFFDGEPTGSVSVPVGRDFTYVYRPRDPGTYMYHCHVEDVEHVHMGMTGLVFVRPLMGKKYAYNDASTRFDREFAMFLSEFWAEAHWADSHIQLPDWTDYKPDFSLLNGRVYPDTLAPNGSVDPFNPVREADGDLIAPSGRPDLRYQPLSALVTCNAGDKVLLRFANLGFREASMSLAGIKMRVVGRDATPMRGRDGTDTSYETDTLLIGAGESYDAIFTAPAHSGGSGPDTYVLYNRAYNRSDTQSGDSGGQRTEIRVYPSGTVAAQQFPNDWGI